MLQQLINHSPDIKRLQDEGYELELINGFLLIHNVPYVNNKRQVLRGTLVSDLTLAANKTYPPKNHVMYFVGDQPCDKDSNEIEAIKHVVTARRLTTDLLVDRSFSNKPVGGYVDYYHKFTQYDLIISSPARSLDPEVTAKNFKPIRADDDESVFNYIDTNSGRAEISNITAKLTNHKVGILGLGGTGSYVLDFLAKTPLAEIRIVDGDLKLQHNAFRCPGAASLEELDKRLKKVDYLASKYSNMHRNILPIDEYINENNLNLLDGLDFVFICLDNGPVKKLIFNKLKESGVPFIDTGIGVNAVKDALTAVVRTTLSTDDKRDHVEMRVCTADDDDDEYASNIQIAELNALNACYAVIRWKRLIGFYHDHEHEYNSLFTLNTNQLLGEDYAA